MVSPLIKFFDKMTFRVSSETVTILLFELIFSLIVYVYQNQNFIIFFEKT